MSSGLLTHFWRPVSWRASASIVILGLLAAALPRAGQAQSVVLEQWALTNNNSATIVSPGTTATVPTLVGLVASNGTQVPSVPANSAFGQAIAPAANGSSWGNATNSPSSRYEEFTYTVAAGYAARLDSLVFSTSLYGGSNGRVSVAYSIDGFATSTFILGSISGTTVTGTTIANTANVMAATDPYQIFRLPLNGGTTGGLSQAAGTTVAFRLYYGIATGSAGRYALVRTFSVKGNSTATTPPCAAASNLAVSSISSTTAQLSFTAPSSNTNYTVTTSPATTMRTVTASPVSLTGLAAGTAYTVSVTSNCAGGNATTATTTFTTTGGSPALTSSVLQRWLLVADGNDEAATRSANVLPSSISLMNMALSDGSTSGYPDYSAAKGQATAPNANGTGWNGTVRPTYYEEFTTTATGGQVRIDSLILSSAFYNTANGELTIAYSTDGFATSTNILTSGAVNNQNNAAGYSLFRLPLTPTTAGVTLTSGQRIAFRFYFAVGTSSSRYALLKTVAVKGEATPTCSNASNLSVTNLTTTSATVNFTPGAGNSSYTVAYMPAGGTATIVSPNPTASPVNLTGLTTGTTYTVTVTSNCAAGQGGAISLTFTTPLTSAQLITWPLQTNMQDNAATRSPALLAQAATLKRLQSADGSVTSVPAHSATNGQGLAPTPNGNWSTPSSVQNVDRRYYEQFVVTAASGYTVRLDSVIFSASGYGSSNGRLAVVYSKSGFTSNDSTDIAPGGKGPGGPLPATNYGAFGNVISLNNQTSGLSDTYRLPLTANAAGVTLMPGEALSIRVYFGVGSSSASRYALLRDVQVTGQVTTPLPVVLTRFEAVRQGGHALLSWATASEHNSQGFAVQVSADGREFRTAGFVPSASPESSQPRSYRFVDETGGPAGRRYYRLQQTDLDGKTSFSPVRVLSFGDLAATFSASPNPFANELWLTTQATAAGRATLSLRDATGRTVYSQPLDVPAGPAKVSISGLSHLPKGLYMLHLDLGGLTQHLKLVKE